ncbi:unnamed protein product, partial [Ectocarpus sp. 13 AM-2016]
WNNQRELPRRAFRCRPMNTGHNAFCFAPCREARVSYVCRIAEVQHHLHTDDHSLSFLPPPPPPPGREYCCDDRKTRAPSDARCGYRTCPAAAAAAADGECSGRLPVAPPAATGVYVSSRPIGYSSFWV